MDSPVLKTIQMESRIHGVSPAQASGQNRPALHNQIVLKPIITHKENIGSAARKETATPQQGKKLGVSFRCLGLQKSPIKKTRHLSHEDPASIRLDDMLKRPIKPGKALPKRIMEIVPADNTIQGSQDATMVPVSKAIASMTANFAKQTLDDDIVDIDAKEKNKLLLCSEYMPEIMKHMFELEKKYPIDAHFLVNRKVNAKMRAILMDWLIQVHFQYNFVAETLYLCNKIMDRYLTAESDINNHNFQLVGLTALFLACKYEEVYVPPIVEFVRLTDEAFNSKQIREMEMKILTKLQFDLSSPQPCFFLRRFSNAAKADIKLHSLAKYIMELSVIDIKLVDLLPSMIAASSLALAMMILKNRALPGLWTKTMEYYTTYSIDSLRPIILKMAFALARAQDSSQKHLQALKDKYAKNKVFYRTSRLEELQLERWTDRIFQELDDPVARWNAKLKNFSVMM